ncbi:radical SAM protein [Halomonas marinisediminis]|uniref:Oxygen-independent coproporphyrinogen III oxidase n=1 Tax=Halomonas marinisediminis TaxID=2546095 RepID=A0ABY2D4W2_9GAMM|nr:radical SAM protein [Halomonas marinisediminis]TDB01524.1 coproporphyrinogen dehydrogenase [Halomonas marinisediminis]
MPVPAKHTVPAGASSPAREPLPGVGDLVTAAEVAYPAPHHYHDGIGAQALEMALAERPAEAPLAIKVRLPFCHHACRFCASQCVSSRSSRQADPYLSRLDREMVLARRRLSGLPPVSRLHWGGAPPAFLSLDQMSDLFDRLDARLGLSGARERDFSIDLDPRETDMLTLRHLQALGFNRLNLGVQELDPRVQQAINRLQPRALTESLVDEADRLGFRELTMSLMLGLPFQTPQGLVDTLEQVIGMVPARIRLYRYRHRPEHHPAQRAIHRDWLPDASTRRQLLAVARARLDAAGYVHIGLGLYTRRNDPLAQAQASGTLGHGPLGFTRGQAGDLLGLGVNATSRIGDLWVRNAGTLAAYESALDNSQLPTARGARLTADERRHRATRETLLCGRGVDPADLPPSPHLERLHAEGLIEMTIEGVSLTAEGHWRLPDILEALALP